MVFLFHNFGVVVMVVFGFFFGFFFCISVCIPFESYNFEYFQSISCICSNVVQFHLSYAQHTAHGFTRILGLNSTKGFIYISDSVYLFIQLTKILRAHIFSFIHSFIGWFLFVRLFILPHRI